MDEHPLAAPQAKFDRAQERLKELFDGLASFHERDPYIAVRYFNKEASEYFWKVDVRETMPRPLTVTLGEALYNLHSGLDQLAAILGADTFPIYKNRNKYWRRETKTGNWASGSGMRKIESATAPCQALIEEVQPYMKGHESHPLWLLHELSNGDKHAAPHLLPIVAVGYGCEIETSPGVRIGLNNRLRVDTGRPLKDGAVFAHFPVDQEFGPEVDMKTEFALDEGFADDAPKALVGRYAQFTLVEILHYVLEDVIAQRFKPYIEGKPPDPNRTPIIQPE